MESGRENGSLLGIHLKILMKLIAVVAIDHAPNTIVEK